MKFNIGDYVKVKRVTNLHQTECINAVGMIYIIPDNTYDFYHIKFLDENLKRFNRCFDEDELELADDDEIMIELL